MRSKTLTTSCGSEIVIVDDFFLAAQRQQHEENAMRSLYIVTRTSALIQQKPGVFFSSVFDEQDDFNFGVVTDPEFVRTFTFTHTMQKIGSWINATLPGSTYYTHSDTITAQPNGVKDKTLLYYINTEWDTNHGGETMFYNMKGEKEIAIDFVPGRMVFFDSLLPHRPAYTYGHYTPRYVYTYKFTSMV
jgi:hypothetical protein